MSKTKAALLPLYLELYDKSCPDARTSMEKFADQIADALGKRGLEISRGKICRVKKEFEAQIKAFEKEKTSAIITLHLAYSPSLESAEALKNTKLPIIVLDTTPDYDFAPEKSSALIMANHGIHGVQDMCNLLRRNNKDFFIEAGHWQKSDVIDRVVSHVKAVKIAENLRHTRAGSLTSPFAGMGDFAIPYDCMKEDIGIDVIKFNPAILKSLLPSAASKEVKTEIALDKKRFNCKNISEETHIASVRTGLAVRKWIEEEQLTAFSANFMVCTKETGLPTVPFFEASKAMARGIGYAGEGDILTASLTGAVLSQFPETSFTEIFCPDWKNNRIFLSHMGEANYELFKSKSELTECGFKMANTIPPIVTTGRFKAGKATFVNLAPAGDSSYSLIAAPIDVIGTGNDKGFQSSIRGWIKPAIPLNDFLAAYSELGGTHHSLFTYGDITRELETLADLMGWYYCNIG